MTKVLQFGQQAEKTESSLVHLPESQLMARSPWGYITDPSFNFFSHSGPIKAQVLVATSMRLKVMVMGKAVRMPAAGIVPLKHQPPRTGSCQGPASAWQTHFPICQGTAHTSPSLSNPTHLSRPTHSSASLLEQWSPKFLTRVLLKLVWKSK